MRWERAVHHVRTAAEEVARARALPFLDLPARELWAVGEVTGAPREDLDAVTVGLAVDLPPDEVAWWTVPERGTWWLGSTRIPKNPVDVWWRSSRAPVWNHRIVAPVLHRRMLLTSRIACLRAVVRPLPSTAPRRVDRSPVRCSSNTEIASTSQWLPYLLT